VGAAQDGIHRVAVALLGQEHLASQVVPLQQSVKRQGKHQQVRRGEQQG
jgi:ribosomal protein L4